MTSLLLSPGPSPTTFRSPDGQLLSPPAGWTVLPPGDAGLTRRVKAAGPSWTVQEKVGRKTFSRGVWAPAENIETARREIEAERATPAYAKKMQASAARRGREQTEYVGSFRDAVLAFLNFASAHSAIAERLADAVTAHATPVGSGTVARTERIPIEERARAAVIAWMRHQTTGYDDMKIARVKGKRREVRRELAARSVRLLEAYRSGAVIPQSCPLRKALA